MAPLAPTSHVPAWKKLGLELKLAKDKPVNKNNKPDETTDAAKSSKKRSISQANGAGAVKKQRLGDDSAGDSEEFISQGSTIHEHQTKSKPQKQKDNSPRKSVSFTSDTKMTDGHPEPEPEPEPEAIDLTPEQRRTEKRKKREQRSKNRQTEIKARTPSTPSDPLLTYLSHFHNARSEWKFQKNRETALLKHVLSVDRIPTSYNPALRTYLEGLKSENSRNRAAEAAKEAIEAEDAELVKIEGQEVVKDKYESAISTYRENFAGNSVYLEDEDVGSPPDLDDSWAKRLEKRRRAELVYFLMRGKIATEKRPAQLQNAKKKRKARTAVVEDTSSSSSESESESDSDTSSSGNSSSASSSEAESGSESKSSSSSSESGSESDSD